MKVVSEDDGQALITELFDLAKLIPLPRALTVKGGAQQGLSINFIAIDVDDSLFISESTFSAVMGDSVTFTGSYLEIEDDSRDTDASNRSVTLSKSISQSNIKIEELRKALDSKWADIRMTKMAIERENSLSQLEEVRQTYLLMLVFFCDRNGMVDCSAIDVVSALHLPVSAVSAYPRECCPAAVLFSLWFRCLNVLPLIACAPTNLSALLTD